MDLLTSAQAAEKFDLAAITCRKAALQGRVPGAKLLGKSWVAPTASWEVWRNTLHRPGRKRVNHNAR